MRLLVWLPLIAVMSGCQAPAGKPPVADTSVASDRQRIIVSYDATAPEAKQRVLEQARAAKLSVIYALDRMNMVVVGDIPAVALQPTIARFRSLPGVLSVEPDGTMHVQEGSR